MKKEKENRKISVRLSNEAYKKVINAVNGGINKSKYINNAIIECNTDQYRWTKSSNNCAYVISKLNLN